MRTLLYPIAALVLWLSAVIFRPEIEARFATASARVVNRSLETGRNPLLPPFRAEAKKWGVKLPPGLAHAPRERTVSARDSEIFTHAPGYYDVIIFGDSSLVWSFSPQIVEQVSGLRVAFFGGESVLPNREFLELARDIAELYLRDDGIAMFMFSEWLWSSSPTEPQRSSEIQTLVEETRSGKRAAFERATNAVLALPRIELYADLVEPRLLPERYRARHFGAQGLGCAFYSWGARKSALFLHCDRNNGEPGARDSLLVDVPFTVVPSCERVIPNEFVLSNVRALFELSLRRRKVLLLPFTQLPAFWLTCAAQSFAQLGLTVVDLPKVATSEHKLRFLRFEGLTHLANSSAVSASAVLGRVVKKAFSSP